MQAHAFLRAMLRFKLAGLRELAFCLGSLTQSTKQQSQLIVRFYRVRIEQNRTFQVLLGFVVLVLSQEYASQFDVRWRVLRVALKQVPEYRDGPIVIANRIIGKT